MADGSFYSEPYVPLHRQHQHHGHQAGAPRRFSVANTAPPQSGYHQPSPVAVRPDSGYSHRSSYPGPMQSGYTSPQPQAHQLSSVVGPRRVSFSNPSHGHYAPQSPVQEFHEPEAYQQHPYPQQQHPHAQLENRLREALGKEETFSPSNASATSTLYTTTTGSTVDPAQYQPPQAQQQHTAPLRTAMRTAGLPQQPPSPTQQPQQAFQMKPSPLATNEPLQREESVDLDALESQLRDMVAEFNDVRVPTRV
jgi:hypothetical protein